MSNLELAIRLFLQLAVILAACRLSGMIGRRLRQSQVVSEMVAGVALGPSLLGAVAPAAQQWLFPMRATIGTGAAVTIIDHPSMNILYALSHVGLTLYMFLVGLEFSIGSLRSQIKTACLISLAGILTPSLLGIGAALVLYGKADLFNPAITPWQAALFLAVSMSITAFPMLARMLSEAGILRSRLGTLTLAAGSVDDALAWVLLATLLAYVGASSSVALLAIGGGLSYVLVMIFVGRPALRIFAQWTERDNGLTGQTLALVFTVVLLCASFTDAVGIYAVFGAFIAGLCMPRGRFAEEVQRHTGLVTTSFLLPTFFTYSGLNTQIGLINSTTLWLIAGALIAFAILGKGLACTVAARLAGEGWRQAVTIGTLMNSRGLMELIVLNIGLERRLITHSLFAMLVMMAIVTTLMASPLFYWVARPEMFARDPVPEPAVKFTRGS